MTSLLDTNILLRSAQNGHAMQELALKSVALLVSQGEMVCVAPQNFCEYWVVCTRPSGENGLGRSVADTLEELVRLRNLFRVLDDGPSILSRWEFLVEKYQVAGKGAHDARLVASMIENQVRRILTFNTGDFRRYQEIEAVAPLDVIRKNQCPVQADQEEP